MARKNDLASVLGSLAGEQVEAPAQTRELAEKVAATRRPGRPRGSKYNREEWGQITFLAKYETADKLRAIADYSRLPIMEVVEQAFNAAIARYEEKNGVIDLDKWRAEKEATKEELFK